MARKDVGKRVLATVVEGGEAREVVLVASTSTATAAVTEVTEGPVTEAAYGSWRHAHRVLGDVGAFARALGSHEGADGVAESLAAFFASREGEDGAEVALLSDLMDLLDQAGEPYTYVAWNAEGDAVRRVE